MILSAIFSKLSYLCEVALSLSAILLHVIFSVCVLLPIWAVFFLSTRVVKLAVTHVPQLARDYRWMASSDALFFLPNLNQILTSADGEQVVNQPYVHFNASVDGRVDVDKVINKFTTYLRACGADVASWGPGDDDRQEQRDADCDVQIDEDTKKMYEKLLYYPVSKFGYTFWKRDHHFDLDYHLPTLKRYDDTLICSESLNFNQLLSSFSVNILLQGLRSNR
jgi:hypothetical protein